MTRKQRNYEARQKRREGARKRVHRDKARQKRRAQAKSKARMDPTLPLMLARLQAAGMQKRIWRNLTDD